MTELTDIKGWLVDLDGTLYLGDTILPGAIEFIGKLEEQKRRFRFVSNTTIYSRRQIAEKLTRLGMNASEQQIFTAPSAAAELLRTFGGVKCYLVVADALREEFDGIDISERNPDYVVIGDVGRDMDYELLNKVFRLVMGGAELIALQKNRFFRGSDGLQIDVGAFVAGLEYSSNKQAKIIGKPSRQFFNLAVHDIRIEAGERWLSAEFAMVGDDIESDIKGAMDAGLLGVLVKTGKYNDSYSEHFGIVPEYSFDSIKDLSGRLG
ncbi:MAG: TIGR01458 family HAD-type hydrolase [Bacteroidetes bacterium]|nr:TIGR01458 family HAD-type hydrolase [Bacteroidota bacterium]MCL5034949.1 TIGR01458 family HAD-type hydrolase [Bacteroidota bacterium]